MVSGGCSERAGAVLNGLGVGCMWVGHACMSNSNRVDKLRLLKRSKLQTLGKF